MCLGDKICFICIGMIIVLLEDLFDVIICCFFFEFVSCILFVCNFVVVCFWINFLLLCLLFCFCMEKLCWKLGVMVILVDEIFLDVEIGCFLWLVRNWIVLGFFDCYFLCVMIWVVYCLVLFFFIVGGGIIFCNCEGELFWLCWILIIIIFLRVELFSVVVGFVYVE